MKKLLIYTALFSAFISSCTNSNQFYKKRIPGTKYKLVIEGEGSKEAANITLTARVNNLLALTNYEKDKLERVCEQENKGKAKEIDTIEYQRIIGRLY